MRVKRERRRREERVIARYEKTIANYRAELSLLAKRNALVIRAVIRDVRKEDIKRIRDSLAKARLEAEKHRMPAKAQHQPHETLRDRAVELNWWLNYANQAAEAIKAIANASKAGLAGLPAGLPPLTYEFAKDFYTYLAPYDAHFSMYALRLNDLTIRLLEGLKADYYVAVGYKLEDVLSPYERPANIWYWLLELMLNYMLKKQRREKIRSKSKGHYGVINYEEPIHTAIDINRIGQFTQPLRTCIAHHYQLLKDKAFSLGYPHKWHKLSYIGVFGIIERKSKYSKKPNYYSQPISIYDRLKWLRRYKL